MSSSEEEFIPRKSSRWSKWREEGPRRPRRLQVADGGAGEGHAVEHAAEVHVAEVNDAQQVEEDLCVQPDNVAQIDVDDGAFDSDGGSDDYIVHQHEEDIAGRNDEDNENDGDEEENASDDDNREEATFNLNHASLNTSIEFRVPRIAKESLLVDLALAERHCWTYEALIQVFVSKNTLFGDKFFPTSKSELWKVLGRTDAGYLEHSYCNCGNYLGRKEFLPDIVLCDACHEHVQLKSAKKFFQVSLKKQLSDFLSTPGIANLLTYRDTRVKRGDVDDVFDGEVYKHLQNTVLGPSDFTYVFNTDGCKLSKGASLSFYPVFVRLNELPPNLRQKFRFLAGLWVGFGEPPMMSFLTPIIEEMRSLYTRGVTWSVDGGEAKVSRFYPTSMCVDGKARRQVLNMTSHNSRFGCTMCLVETQNKRYPAAAQCVDRTHAGMIADMISARNTPRDVNGHKGVTPLMLLEHFNLVEGQAFDDLHNFYECLTIVLTDLIIDEVPKLNGLSKDVFLETLDSRLSRIKVPSKISREPDSYNFTKRNKIKGSQARNFLLYYSVPCLNGLIHDSDLKLVGLISHAAFLLSLDSITEDQIALAESYIDQFLVLYEERFTIEKTRANIHVCKHAAKSVRCQGPLWSYSTFNFESWNQKILNEITSPKGSDIQIMNRHFIHSFLITSLYNEEISNEVRQQLRDILERKKLVHAREVQRNIHVLGKPITRAPTHQEMSILEREGYVTRRLNSHTKILIKGVKYVCEENVVPGGKSNNSVVFTWENTFCTIKSIVTFGNDRNEDEEVCGMFVSEHSIDPRRRGAFVYAKHIAKMRPREEDLFHFIRADLVRTPAIIMHILDDKYVVNMTNTFEID